MENTESFENSTEKYRALAEKLAEHTEGFPFPGLTESAYAKLKADSVAFPEYAMPIDEVMEKMKDGIKIVVEANGNVFILPLHSDDVENESIFPWQLTLDSEMDDDLRTLIQLRKK